MREIEEREVLIIYKITMIPLHSFFHHHHVASLQQFYMGTSGTIVGKLVSSLFLRFFGEINIRRGPHVFLSLSPFSFCNQTEEIMNFSPFSLHPLSLFSISPQPNTMLMYMINIFLV
ncbi:hypothetical protein MtrunA17_Chr8g0371301 [Medicago truncatula]|uniref:Uncharacterized protein n=1 Tax=Medicago truncatula TaxID=3880 RepID=A0A072U3J6_MEDTR|nr:hypothetical protein MTR_8g074907 [Medicago truncatula]RHN41928.1 hypothetical protein MtrunA17_Chr8g0371301 [Medicago truncatula]